LWIGLKKENKHESLSNSTFHYLVGNCLKKRIVQFINKHFLVGPFIFGSFGIRSNVVLDIRFFGYCIQWTLFHWTFWIVTESIIRASDVYTETIWDIIYLVARTTYRLIISTSEGHSNGNHHPRYPF